MSASYEFLNKTGLQELATKIAATYATISSVPTAVSDLTNDLDFQTGTEVASAIGTAIAGVTQFDYEIVEELPTTGEKGVIYMVPNSSSTGSNLYDEYFWYVSGDPAVGHFEKFGEQMVTVIEYVGEGTYVEVVDGTGANAGKKVIQLTSTKSALLDSALQGITSTGSTINVTGSGTTKNLEVSSTIVNGAAAGATALQPADVIGDGTYATVSDGTGANVGKRVVNIASAKQALIDGALQGVTSTGSTVTITGEGTTKNLEVSSTIVSGAAAGATAVQSVTSTGSTIVATGSGTTKNLEVSETIVNGAAAGATALQAADFDAISNSYIDGLFE